MKKTLTSLAFLLFIISSLTGQLRPGYIVNNSGDTIRGFIYSEGSLNNSFRCKFISLPDSIEHNYLPGEIKMFRINNGKCFSSSDILINGKRTTIFLEWLIKARVSIFTYTSPGMGSRYFLQVQGDSLRELINTVKTIERIPKGNVVAIDQANTYLHERKEYVGTLLLAFRDCPSIFPVVQNTILSSKPLIKISKLYQSRTCPGEECLVFEDKERATSIEIGASVNFASSKLMLNNGLPELAIPALSPGIGIGFNFSNLGIVSRKFSLSVRFAYYSLKYVYDSTLYFAESGDICKLYLLSIPLQVNYAFSYGKFTPVLSLGVSTNFRFGYKQYDRGTVNYITKSYDYFEGMSLFQPAVNAGFGFRYSLKPKTVLNLKFDFEHAFRFFGTRPGDYSYNNNIFISASIYYRIK